MKTCHAYVCLVLLVVSRACAHDLPNVVTGAYPRAFFFRAAESAGPMIDSGRRSYESWDRTFSRLGGIMGKSLEEEVLGRSANIPYFTRFKREHPSQLVMLHYNGNARDPRDGVGLFSPEHWVYFNGCRVTESVEAVSGESELHVEDTRLFQVSMGRYRTSNEDVGICMLDDRGRPNWRVCEQVQLLGIDAKKNVLRVKRGCFGSKPLAFPGGKGYVAAHVTEGPWGSKNNLLWYYNYATNSPRDAAGKQCIDVLVDDLAGLLAPGGKLEAYDGIEFDVLHDSCGGRRGARRGPDVDADGTADWGYANGVNVYGAGVIEFCRRLRERIGNDRLLTADGGRPGAQRAFGYLNGIESEGWPWLADWAVKDWSGGLNRHLYWRRYAREPVFNYFNHKYTMAGPTQGSRQAPEVPFSTHRLVLATAQCVDAAVCYSTPPPREKGEAYGIWDELWKGKEKQTGWLGAPLHATARVAFTQPDLLCGRGCEMSPEFVRRVRGGGCEVSVRHTALRITGRDANADALHFRLCDLPVDGEDLVLRVTLRGDPLRDAPAGVPRLAWVALLPPEELLVTAELPAAGICLRGQTETALDRDTGASVTFMAQAGLDGVRHDAYQCHPPYAGKARGYTFWQRSARVPEDGELLFYTGLSEKAATRSDGVTFRVLVRVGDEAWRPVFEHHVTEWRWREHRVSLDPWNGKQVHFKFITDCGPKNNATTDHAKWGDVTVLRKGAPPPAWRNQRFMTFVGAGAFESSFYFRDLQGESADLEFEIEGGGAVSLQGVAAYASPDLLAREFEHGIVLANPAHHSVRVDLAKHFPNRTFRRLRGRPHQDPKTNNGKPVGRTIELGPIDGLFLVEDKN